ncbi:MAG TPA: sigma-70 family RNA polymerase sigma factor [Pyrinomonadaceae bacterium]|nr:sigma-70 family RNA polymerase sigma factor [Pyrinomonadaceae bacterium]
MSSYQTALQNENLIPRADDQTANGAVRSARTDRQLVDLVLAGDGSAFEQIFDRHKRMVAVVAGRYLRRPEQIEEIIQISFGKAFVELAKFRGLHDLSLASWLSRITVNACVDVLRTQKRKPENLCCELTDNEHESLIELAADSDARSVETELLDRDLAEKLLSRVGEEDRALLQMLYAEEMSVAEIAEVTGWSQSKVKIKAWRTRNSLRRIMKKYL